MTPGEPSAGEIVGDTAYYDAAGLEALAKPRRTRKEIPR